MIYVNFLRGLIKLNRVRDRELKKKTYVRLIKYIFILIQCKFSAARLN